MSETRTGQRFPLHLPIRITSESQGDGAACGTTENLSSAGVFIRSDAGLAVGSEVEFEITLPAREIGSPADVRLLCRGRVVRTESAEMEPAPESGDRGLACIIDSYTFIRND